MNLYLKKIFYLKPIIKIRNFFNFRPLNMNKKILNGKVSVSDSFCWRTDKGFKTIIRFSDIPKTFYNIKQSQADIIIYNKKYELIKKIKFKDLNLLNEFIISKETLNGVEDYGVFFIFHKFEDQNLSNIFIANRCYLGFSKNNNMYSFVHGNTLSRYVNMEDYEKIETDIIQNTSIKYGSKYKIQNYFDKSYINEIFLANPTSKKVEFQINKEKKILNNGESAIIKINSNKTILIESNCLFFRPIIFTFKDKYMDVYHG